MGYLCVEQVRLIQSAGALGGGVVFTAGVRHCVVVGGVPGGVGPAGVIFDTAALQLHRDKQRTDRSQYKTQDESRGCSQL